MADHQNRGPKTTANDFVAHTTEVFARRLFQPMFEHASQSPDDVRNLIGEIRHKLDALETVVDTMLPRARNDTPSTEFYGENSTHFDTLLAASDKTANSDPAADPYDDIGRNQRSRLRELTLLDYLARDTHAYSLQQVLVAINDKGFDDTSGAVVSQLHRLKKLGVINQPAGGMYEITPQGLSHLHKLRASFGSLLGSAQA